MKRSSRAYVLTSVFVAALLALCAGGHGSAQQSFGPWGVDLTARDQKVKPGDDFFEYANGGWLARTPIPPDQASASAGRDIFNLTAAGLMDGRGREAIRRRKRQARKVVRRLRRSYSKRSLGHRVHPIEPSALIAGQPGTTSTRRSARALPADCR